ncbi:MAG: divalent-cation tolerance protein CutA [Zoogloeaceae bacterium]|nr:divalent-cation tolerance protein CutA [Zoogloeaceae bacterium]
MTATLLMLTTLPDGESADRLATALVENHLAACVSALPVCRSTFRWQGRVETANETLLLIKTRTEHYAAAEALIRSQHPYELPEIIALPIERGLPAYLEWIAHETEPPCLSC